MTEPMTDAIAGRTILLTGGAGSVGQILLPRLLSSNPEVVRIFDSHEPGLSRLKSRFSDDRCRFLMGDVRDSDRLRRALKDVDVLIHTAAMKHVDVSEYNPFEAVKTNVMGLQNTVDAAIDSSVSRFVYTSSDKAVQPANTMGTTKLLGEKLVTAGNKYAGRSDLRLTSVRFGNVLGSSRSVIPIFRRQIAEGGPVTLTDERMTRFFLTKTQTANLILGALHHTMGGEVFLHDMVSIRIRDLAHVMIEELAPAFGHDPAEIDMEIVGPRIGETLHEKVVTKRESSRALQRDELYAIPPESTKGNGYLSYDGLPGFKSADDLVISSNDGQHLDRTDIGTVLDDAGVLDTPP